MQTGKPGYSTWHCMGTLIGRAIYREARVAIVVYTREARVARAVYRQERPG